MTTDSTISNSATESSSTKHSNYLVLHKYSGFEIRDYPAILYASVLKKGRMMEAGNDGFRDLAGYIFGGNEKSQKMAMTAPVTFHLSADVEDRMEMSFTLPDGVTLANAPKPDYPQVKIHQEAPVRLAVLSFSGFANNEKIEDRADQLRLLLKKEGIKWLEPCRFMAYNSPYRLFFRRNEVAFVIQN